MIFRLYSNCVITRGVKNSIIIDLQNSCFYALGTHQISLIDKLLNMECINDGSLDSELDIFMSQLIFEKLGYLTDEPNRFPAIKEKFEVPSIITNAIIDIDKNFDLKWLNLIISQLETLLCKNIQIRIYTILEIDRFIEFLSTLDLKGSFIQNISLILNADNYNNIKHFHSLRLKHIKVFNWHTTDIIFTENNFELLEFTTETLYNEKQCGCVKIDNFSPNYTNYFESRRYNSCLNRKISIDKNGYIKNCPSMRDSYGHISTVKLSEVVSKSEFKDVWSISKDKINICNGCEFRYICMDCRAYLEDPENSYSKPLKCGYNPLTGEWSDWSKNPLRKKVIELYSN